MDGRPEGAVKAPAGERALAAGAVAHVRAAAGLAGGGIGDDAPGDEDEAMQLGLGPDGAAGHAATLRRGYEATSPSGSAASGAGSSPSSSGTSTGAATASGISASAADDAAEGTTSSVGWWASAWWLSRPQ